ncbi:MAG: amidohydrolase [Proteobacteria bacterium]|nr:amidohydrolase [Burkholderiales bacterium]
MSQQMLIAGGSVLNPASYTFAPADIVVSGDTIDAIVAPGSVGSDGRKVVDASSKLVIPGLVNGHNHAQTNLSKGIADRWTLEILLNHAPWTGGRRTLDEKYLSAAIGACEMLRKGCTASYDMFAEFPLPTIEGVNAVAQAYADVGIRASIAPMMADRSFYEAIPGLIDALPEPLREQALAIRFSPFPQSVAVCRELAEDWKFDRMQIRPALGPTIPHHCSDEFLQACGELGRELDLGLQMHVAESKLQAVVARKRYGKSLVAHLDTLGLLKPGFCVAHGVWLDDEDRTRLADQGASVSHNPGSNMKLGSGLADTRSMLARGVNLALGTDGAGSSDNLNMFEAMRLASFVSRVHDRDSSQWLSTREVLRAATEGGAKALGFEGMIGRLEAGYKADIVLLDLGAPHYVPLNDPVNQIVHCEDGTGVHTVIAGGRVLLEAGRFTAFDFDALRARAATAVARLSEVNRASRALSEQLEPYVNQYCSGLAATPLHVAGFCSH